MRRFVLFHGKRHPDAMGASEVVEFLSDLAVRQRVSASTQNQALSALLFLYRAVLGRELEGLGDAVRARRPERLPVVLSRAEVRAVIAGLPRPHALIATLLYGGGLRLLEALRLRVKDVDFQRHQLTVREPKGMRDRAVPLPRVTEDPLQRHLVAVRRLHAADLARGLVGVPLPGRLAEKYPTAPREWAWQWVFPATRAGIDRERGRSFRHHLHETAVQRGGQAERGARRDQQAGELPCAATLLRHTSAGRWGRHPDGSGAARPPRAAHHHDLHPRARAGSARRPQPGRPVVGWVRGRSGRRRDRQPRRGPGDAFE